MSLAGGFVEATVADSDVCIYPILRESHVVRRMLVTERPSAAAAVMTAAEGVEGAAADVAVAGLLERRRRPHGPSAPAARSGSGPELACLLRHGDRDFITSLILFVCDDWRTKKKKNWCFPVCRSEFLQYNPCINDGIKKTAGDIFKMLRKSEKKIRICPHHPPQKEKEIGGQMKKEQKK